MTLQKIREHKGLNLLRTSLRAYVCRLMQHVSGFKSRLKIRLRQTSIKLLRFLIQKLTELCAWLERSETSESLYEVDRSLRLPNRALHTTYRRNKGLFDRLLVVD